MAGRKKSGGSADTMDAPAPVVVADAILSPEEAVRWQAGNLREAIVAARAAGFVIATPFRLDELDRITISATSKAL